MGSKKALVGLLAPPMLWLVVAYLGALVAIFATAFFTTDPFTNEVVPTFTTENFTSPPQPHLPAHHRPDAVHRGHGHRAVHRHRGALRVLHGAGGAPAAEAPPRGGGAGAAVGLVPRQGLCLADDGAAQRCPRQHLRNDSRVRLRGGRPHADLPVAAVHDPSGVCRLRATPGVAPGGLGGSGCQGAAHVPAGRPAGPLAVRSRPGPCSRSR